MLYGPGRMGRFDPTGPIDVPGLEHSVATLSWGVLRGALGPSDGTAGAASNVPSALGGLRHAQIYLRVPTEIDDAFAVLEQHVMRGPQLYPVVLAALPFLFDTLRRGSPIAERIAELIARYASRAKSLDPAQQERFATIIADHAPEVIRWFGRHDRALGALAIHVPALRELFIAAVEGAEFVSPIVLLALVELETPAGDTPDIARAMLYGADSTDAARMCAASFLASFGEVDTELLAEIDSALPPTAGTMLRNLVDDLWEPLIERPQLEPEMLEAEVVFAGKKIVLVKTGDKSITLPWVGADVEAGARLKIGLTQHGQPKLAVISDWRGNTRVIDF